MENIIYDYNIYDLKINNDYKYPRDIPKIIKFINNIAIKNKDELKEEWNELKKDIESHVYTDIPSYKSIISCDKLSILKNKNISYYGIKSTFPYLELIEVKDDDKYKNEIKFNDELNINELIKINNLLVSINLNDCTDEYNNILKKYNVHNDLYNIIYTNHIYKSSNGANEIISLITTKFYKMSVDEKNYDKTSKYYYGILMCKRDLLNLYLDVIDYYFHKEYNTVEKERIINYDENHPIISKIDSFFKNKKFNHTTFFNYITNKKPIITDNILINFFHYNSYNNWFNKYNINIQNYPNIEYNKSNTELLKGRYIWLFIIVIILYGINILFEELPEFNQDYIKSKTFIKDSIILYITLIGLTLSYYYDFIDKSEEPITKLPIIDNTLNIICVMTYLKLFSISNPKTNKYKYDISYADYIIKIYDTNNKCIRGIVIFYILFPPLLWINIICS